MSISKWKGWTDWEPLDGLDFRTVTTGPGVYVIAANKPLSRVVGVDRTGILDIGEAGWLRSRLRMFYRSASGNKKVNHSAGRHYLLFKLDRHIPFRTLRVRWTELKTKAEAKHMEGKLQREYIKHHCELPPLNANFTWS